MRGEGGTIVNVSSILGERVSKGLAAYAASKAGLIQLTKALALEWAAFDIRVNALAPGYIETDLNRDFFASDAGQRLISRIPQKRLGDRKSVVPGKRVSVRVDLGGRRLIKKKKNKN